MRISDWSSDVCSSDLRTARGAAGGCRFEQRPLQPPGDRFGDCGVQGVFTVEAASGILSDVEWRLEQSQLPLAADRKSVVSGKSVSVRVDLGGSSILKKKKR